MTTRKILIRFASQSDVDDFIKKTGININTKMTRCKYAPKLSLKRFIKRKTEEV